MEINDIKKVGSAFYNTTKPYLLIIFFKQECNSIKLVWK